MANGPAIFLREILQGRPNTQSSSLLWRKSRRDLHRCLWPTASWERLSPISGEFQAARLHLDRAVALYVPEEHRSLATRFGQDIGVAALIYRSLVLYRLGYPESAAQGCGRGIEGPHETSAKPAPCVYAVGVGALLEILCGRFARGRSARRGTICVVRKTMGCHFGGDWASCCGAASSPQLIGPIRRPN